ncbi:MAG: FAD-dependent oxidoreductase [Deltaproteobacteria bacterium]|nr:FAD-dependent oxidoreductase [Deltaproteobacteria bacterium]
MNGEISEMKTIIEPAREIKVLREADIVVVGGGPGGHSAAVSAARNGARTVLIERYGHLGGMATGGLVAMIPHLSGGSKEPQLAGLCQEWIERLDAKGAALHPEKEDLGSDDPNVIDYWQNRGIWFVSDEGRVRLTVIMDPEILKCVLNDMVEEAGVKLLLHSWGTRAIVENDQVKGVIFESKSGRQAILAKVVIDATGDGDLLPSAGADFTAKMDVHLRIRNLAVVFKMGNVDLDTFIKFRQTEPEKYAELVRQVFLANGFPVGGFRGLQDGVVWVNNFVPGMGSPRISSLDVEDLTLVERYVRKRMMITLDFYRKRVPGFERSFILTTAPQIGTRGGRRVIGEYTLTEQDMHSGRIFTDTIAMAPHLEHDISPEHPVRCFPYRCLVPIKLEGLLVAGRSFSSEDRVNEMLNLIGHCIALGQAAGTAASLAIKGGVRLRDVNYADLQKTLLRQGVPLPI